MNLRTSTISLVTCLALSTAGLAQEVATVTVTGFVSGIPTTHSKFPQAQIGDPVTLTYPVLVDPVTSSSTFAGYQLFLGGVGSVRVGNDPITASLLILASGNSSVPLGFDLDSASGLINGNVFIFPGVDVDFSMVDPAPFTTSALLRDYGQATFTSAMGSFNVNSNGMSTGQIIASGPVTVSIDSPIGSAFCVSNTQVNSTGSIGQLGATGTTVATANAVTFQASSLPANEFGILLAALSDAGSTVLPQGGFLCLSSTVSRFDDFSEIFQTDAQGSASFSVDLLSFGPGPFSVTAGSTWYFQAWHRDSAAGQDRANLTHGLEINFR